MLAPSMEQPNTLTLLLFSNSQVLSSYSLAKAPRLNSNAKSKRMTMILPNTMQASSSLFSLTSITQRKGCKKLQVNGLLAMSMEFLIIRTI